MDTKAAPPRTAPERSLKQRLAFIEFRLYWEGRANRSGLMQRFGVSAPQAAIDLRAYREQAPGNALYDARARAYVPGPRFAPRFWHPDAAEYLGQLDLKLGPGEDAERSWIGAAPDVDMVPVPARVIDPTILRDIVRGIREGSALRIFYQSGSAPEPRWRRVMPLRLVSDGQRWHMRGFDPARGRHQDYVLARTLRVRRSARAAPDVPEDRDWNTIVEVVLGPNSDMEPGLRRAYAFDYGMTGAELHVPVRRALLFYFLTNLRLDFDRLSRKPARVHPLVVRNHAEVETALRATGWRPIRRAGTRGRAE
jgi:hypothetical protein